MTEEVWKEIGGYESLYTISNMGRIMFIKKMKASNRVSFIKKQTKLSNGYLSVKLYKNNKGVTHLTHRLIAKAFIANPENKRTVNHKDGNKLNNSIENLEWNTDSENNRHAIRMFGRKKRNPLLPSTKEILNEQQVLEIFSKRNTNKTELMREYKIARNTLYRVLNGITYKRFNLSGK